MKGKVRMKAVAMALAAVMSALVLVGCEAAVISPVQPVAPTAQSTASTSTPEGLLLQDFEELEGLLPIPTPVYTIEMGAFDAQTGEFTGNTTKVEYESLSDLCPEGPQGCYHLESRYLGDWLRQASVVGNRIEFKETFAPMVDAVHLLLTFRVKNADGGTFEVVANGVSQSAPASEGELTVNVRDAGLVEWTVNAGGRSYSDSMRVRRPHIIGAGAFTIPVLPVTIVYEPPQDVQRRSKATYSKSGTIGTSTQLIFAREGSTTRPGAAPLEYEALNNMRTILGTLIDAVKLGDALSKEVDLTVQGKILELMEKLLDGLGKVEVTRTIGNTEVSTSEEGWILRRPSDYTSAVNDGGPGIGDTIYYLYNVKVVWLAQGARVTLGLLGWEGESHASAVDLKRYNPDELAQYLSLKPDTARLLLSLDPFAEDPSATQQTYTEKEVATLELCWGPGDGPYSVEVYQDNVFGTFAFRQVPASREPVCAGTVLAPDGQPLAGASIELNVGGKRFTAVSNEEGYFAFYALTIQPGAASVVVNGQALAELSLNWDLPIRDLELRLTH